MAWTGMSKNTDVLCGVGKKTVSWLTTTEVPKFPFAHLDGEAQTTPTTGHQCNGSVTMKPL